MACAVLILYVFPALLYSNAAKSDAAAAAACANTTHCLCAGAELRCRGGLPDADVWPAVHSLTLLDVRLPVLEPLLLRQLPGLRRLALHNCSTAALADGWAHPHLEHVDLADNSFRQFRLEWLEGLPSLRTLNISHNPLETMAESRPVQEKLVTIVLPRGRWDCTVHALTWLYRWRRAGGHLAGAEHARCLENRKDYRTMDGHQLLEVLRLTEEMLQRCPSAAPFGCSCDLVQVDGAPGDAHLTPVIVEVYCDDLGLHEFPPRLPAYTTKLSIKNNSLTGFGPVIGNQSDYQSLTALFMDGNWLEADQANRLEGSGFIHRFSVLSLARNRLQTLPLYAFDNAFKKNSFNVDSLFLGGNPWLCDCGSPFTFSFQTWLASQHKLIRDGGDVRCGSGPLAEDMPPPGRPVASLCRSQLCGRIMVNMWDVANGLLATAVLVLAVKFAYDVTVYRRTGKLPLLVSKFPC